MAVKILFDDQHNPIAPTLILATRSGKRLGVLPAENIVFRGELNNPYEMTFRVHKKACLDSQGSVDIKLWNNIKDFKLVYANEYDKWFEVKLDIEESTSISKSISLTSLGHAELSQINLNSVYVNTEEDIERDDYSPTVFYNPSNKESSLLDRLLEKAPHYKIGYVDTSLQQIQKTYSFDGKAITDALSEVSEETECLIELDCSSDENGKISRTINAYDLKNFCNICYTRGDFNDVCPNCGSTEISFGYGNDTTVFVSSENLGKELTYSTDTDQVKNCFRIEAGDDLMTAAAVSCNPNGSQYIWHITDEMKEDMSDDLVSKLNEYDDLYNEYQTTEKFYFEEASDDSSSETGTVVNVESIGIVLSDGSTVIAEGGNSLPYNVDIVDNGRTYHLKPSEINVLSGSSWTGNEDILLRGTSSNGSTSCYSQYNALVEKYQTYRQDLNKISNPVVGYPGLIEAYYETIDFELFLRSELMPSVEMQDTTAEIEAAKLTSSSMSPVAVANIDACSLATATNSVQAMAKTIVDQRYQVKADGVSYLNGTWTGTLNVTNKSDSDDTAATDSVTVSVNDDLETFVAQKIKKTLVNAGDGTINLSRIFSLNLSDFSEEIKKYCLNRLVSMYDSCRAAINIMVEQNISSDKENPVYTNLYYPYYQKFMLLEKEISLREYEISVISGSYDEDGLLTTQGLQNVIIGFQSEVQSILNFQEFIGDELWEEFVSYRREDTYKNANYISDGLNNAELFERAIQFVETATSEIVKSATKQHHISGSLYNLLMIKDFDPITNSFEIGNWIRVEIDEKVYKLRLLSYEIDYDNPGDLAVEFSDVTQSGDVASDLKNILSNAKSMATSYSAVVRQAKQGKKSLSKLDHWAESGLDLTNTKIVNAADNQSFIADEHGMLFRGYSPESGDFSSEQVKVINSGIYMTDDGWQTSRAGVGRFIFTNPKTGEQEVRFGVIADTVAAAIVLSQEVGIYNESNTISMDENGLVITVKETEDGEEPQIPIRIIRETEDGTEDILSVDSNGHLILDGSVQIQSNGQVSQFGDSIDSILDNMGNSQQDISSQIIALQSGVSEQFKWIKTDLDTVHDDLSDEIASFEKEINGQIKRGFIHDPDSNNPDDYIFGIAIAESIEIQENENPKQRPDDPNSNLYYKLKDGQTFGFYTANGWQFWVRGQKRGWFNSSDGMLHTVQQVIESDLSINGWMMVDNNGLGIKYIGG